MYTLEKFESEQTIEAGAPRNVFVALVRKDNEEQPFRVLIENFNSKEEALSEVNAWIREREREDSAAEVERERLAQEQRQASLADELNEDLNNAV